MKAIHKIAVFSLSLSIIYGLALYAYDSGHILHGHLGPERIAFITYAAPILIAIMFTLLYMIEGNLITVKTRTGKYSCMGAVAWVGIVSALALSDYYAGSFAQTASLGELKSVIVTFGSGLYPMLHAIALGYKATWL